VTDFGAFDDAVRVAVYGPSSGLRPVHRRERATLRPMAAVFRQTTTTTATTAGRDDDDVVDDGR
jgi:hypothetical protein